MRLVSLIIAAILASAGCASPASESIGPVTADKSVTANKGLSKAELAAKELAVKLNFLDGGGYCGSVAVGPHALLTAKHCISPGIRGIRLNRELAVVTRVIYDDADHAILVVSKKFDKIAKIGPRPGVGASLFMWGNSEFDDLFRRGYVTNHVTFNWPNIGSRNIMLMDLMVAGGDSGSGIFDENGVLIGTLTGNITWDSASMSCVLQYNFKMSEIKDVVTYPEHLTK